MRRLAILTLLLAIPSLSQAGEPAWKPLTEELIRTEKPGYGKLCGVYVDHATGALTINLSDKGFYRSTDQGKTWKHIGEPVLKGRTETPGCLLQDPTGKTKRMVVALVYGSPIGVSPDAGETWSVMDKKSQHVDWYAVDWSSPELAFVLTLKHEANGLLLASHDGGRNFTELGKNFGPAWIFDKQTAVVAQAASKENKKPGLLRTTDAGKSFTPAGDYQARTLPRWHDGVLYWLTDTALISTTDQGQTWKKLSDVKDVRFGPVFGKTADHLFILTGAGIQESKDGAKTWTTIMLPKELRQVGALTWLDYDPTADIVYAMKMTSELYQLRR